jgi:ElaB/YqjD/DUF883 family membrane-anchored ribosome-binding protein
MELWREEMENLIDASGMSTDELRRLAVSGVDYFTNTLGLSQEQAEFLAQTLEDRLVDSLNEARGAAQHAATGGMDKLRESTEEATEATDDFIGAQLALTSPVLAAVRAAQQAEEAQRKMNAAVQKYGENSPEAIEATLNYVEALTKADGAADVFASEGGPAAIQAFENAAREAGISEEQISAVIAALERLNKIPAPKNPFVNYPKGTPWLPDEFPNPNIPGFASGGVVPGPRGAPMMAVVHGGEEVLTPEQRSGGASTVITLNALTLSDRLLKEVQEMARRS